MLFLHHCRSAGVETFMSKQLQLFFLSLIFTFFNVSFASPRPCQTDGSSIVGADFYNTLGTVEQFMLSGRLIRDHVDLDRFAITPLQAARTNEVKNASLKIYIKKDNKISLLGEFSSDAEGYFTQTFNFPTQHKQAGLYQVLVEYNDCTVGEANLRLLDMNHNGIVVRSDIDWTYLETDFQSSSGLLKTLRSNAKSKRNLPAMPIVYQGLRNGVGFDNRPLQFLSGSPRFFKRVLESKMHLDGIEQDGMVLKPIKDIMYRNIKRANLIRLPKALKQQIGYKLHALLVLRSFLPPSAHEVLLGDDTEADVVVYNLYHRFLANQLTTNSLVGELKDLAVSKHWQMKIFIAATALEKLSMPPMPVKGIYINHTGKSTLQYPFEQWKVPNITLYHKGAWPLVLKLYEQGWVDKTTVLSVRNELKQSSYSDSDLNDHAEHALQQGVLLKSTVDLFR